MRHSGKGLLKIYRDMPIRIKLISVLFIQILIPLVLIGYLSYKNSEGIIKENATDYSRDILNLIQLRLDDYIDNLTEISQDLLYEDKIYDVLKSGISVDDPLRRYEYEDTVNSHLKMVVISRPEIKSLCIYANDGRTFYQDDNTREVGLRESIPYKVMLDKARLKKGKPYFHIVAENKRVKEIYLARQINDTDRFNELGLLVMRVKKELIDEAYQGLTGNLQNIAILSTDMELIASRDYDDMSRRSEVLFDKITGDLGEKIDEKAGVFISYTTMKKTGWKIVVYAALNELYKDASMLRRNIIMLCTVVIAMLAILTMFIAMDIVKPLNQLVDGMKMVQSGESSVHIQVDREDELGFLNRAFNEMSSEIHHLVNWVYREQLTRKEAELKALQSQINPHFLFNTLEAINWMARLNNIPEISSTVSDLSELMEASIGRDDRLISVKEEFTYVDKYISLQKRRFGDKIELIKNVQPDVNNIKIPRLLIQPLIENAVYHGLEGMRGKGVITINAKKQNDSITIEVLDNGNGMAKEDLQLLNERLAMDNDTYFRNLSARRSGSIGIENVNRRIKLFYGEGYGLRIESETGKYTKAEVTVPLEIDSEAGKGYYVQGFDN